MQIFLFTLSFISGFILSTLGSANSNPNIKNDFILIINTYTEAFPWSSSIISPITKKASNNLDVSVLVEHTNMFTERDYNLLQQIEENFRQRLNNEVKLTFVAKNEIPHDRGKLRFVVREK